MTGTSTCRFLSTIEVARGRESISVIEARAQTVPCYTDDLLPYVPFTIFSYHVGDVVKVVD